MTSPYTLFKKQIKLNNLMLSTHYHQSELKPDSFINKSIKYSCLSYFLVLKAQPINSFSSSSQQKPASPSPFKDNSDEKIRIRVLYT